ncbi:MAG: DUF5690 family protein [Myxococcota bacterium]
MPHPLRSFLDRAPRPVFVVYAIFAAFSTYFCMYAFRKPFAAASFEGLSFLGTQVDLKTAFVISQIIGYTLSKYAGIKFVSEVSDPRRARSLIVLVGVAQLALIAFATLPDSLMAVALFINGLCLGMIWGLVVRYLEGRKSSELLLAGLSTSFIVASGAVKDVGRWLMRDFGVSESLMPAAVGGLFFLPFLLAVWLLDQIPPPSEEDIALRVERPPMDGAARLAFLRQFAGGLIPLLLVYVAATAYRDFRDNYGVEIFSSLGYEDEPGLFTQTELPVALGVLAVLAALNLLKNNRRGLIGAFVVMLIGTLILVGATALLGAGAIDGLTFMIAVGLGSYLVYVTFNTVLFERVIAATRVQATAVFAIYVADALGYTGSIAAQLYKDFGEAGSSRLEFFIGFSYVFAAGAAALLAVALLFFVRRTRSNP